MDRANILACSPETATSIEGLASEIRSHERLGMVPRLYCFFNIVRAMMRRDDAQRISIAFSLIPERSECYRFWYGGESKNPPRLSVTVVTQQSIAIIPSFRA
jgi:hypothetical protein